MLTDYSRSLFCAFTFALLVGCASPQRSEHRPFVFHEDTFAYANELVWRYDFDPVTGKTSHVRENPKPDYTHHCFVVARAARQFFENARFDPTAPVADTNTYQRLIRQVMAKGTRSIVVPEEQVVIPGYSNLFEFSRAYEKQLKAECGGAWQSYFQRGHWRMIFPIGASHQQRMAQQLAEKIGDHQAPLVHVVCFPQLSINHAVVLFDCKKTDTGFEFAAYDPNDPKQPLAILYDESARTFSFPRTRYFAGGRVKIYEIFYAWDY